MAPASILRTEIDQALVIIGGICIALLAGITVAMVVFVVRFRQKRSPAARQVEGNTALEIAWTVIPTLIVLYMFYVGYAGFQTIRTSPAGARLVRVFGQQWNWTFEYPLERIASDRLFLPAGEPCRFEITSRDVIHGFYIPAFRVKEDAVPGRTNHLWIDPGEPGEYNIFCSAFCGKDHAQMVSRLIVLPPAEFSRWVDGKVREQYAPVDMNAALDPNSARIAGRNGPQLFATYCASCHGLDGRGGLVEGARDFTTLEKWKQGVTVTAVFRTLATGVQGTQMRSFAHLPAWDRFALAHHVASFFKGSRPQPAEEDVKALVRDFELDRNRLPPARISIEAAMRQIAAEAEKQP